VAQRFDFIVGNAKGMPHHVVKDYQIQGFAKNMIRTEIALF
jgi:hypothetical protein